MIEKVRLLTAILVLLLVNSAFSGTCEQNATTILCERQSSSNPLFTIRGDVSRVETIIVHNAEMDLTDDLLKIDTTLPNVSLMNLTGNSIERIGPRGFDKVHNVQYLYLSRNPISMTQADTFMSLTRLERLEMNDAIAGSSEFKLHFLLSILHTKHKFVHLTEIQLNDNEIEELHPITFCGVQGLLRLELSNNKLESLDFTAKCFSNLKALFVAGNKIHHIPADLWDRMPSLTSLDISKNPLHCDCSMVEMVKSDDISFLNQGKTFCASPLEVKGMNVFDLPKEYCKKDSGYHTFRNCIVLVIIGAVCLFLYKKYRDRLPKWSGVASYHNIDHENVVVQPEFV
ncbi:unnamed protein product [Caenorhabditis bovis]|uniref:LRRCT domain-containing protein n=1 Tax=Caenorhabditis bovis TaxID=2654633 RepID=A0A8S1F4Z4_9PELO|nr:unnamed protein product [Caenorhabditis bovis]